MSLFSVSMRECACALRFIVSPAYYAFKQLFKNLGADAQLKLLFGSNCLDESVMKIHFGEMDASFAR